MESRSELYLKQLVEGEGELPLPESRMDEYLYCLITNGDKEKLPKPRSRLDSYLNELCQRGLASDGGGSYLQNITVENISYIFVTRKYDIGIIPLKEWKTKLQSIVVTDVQEKELI